MRFINEKEMEAYEKFYEEPPLTPEEEERLLAYFPDSE